MSKRKMTGAVIGGALLAIALAAPAGADDSTSSQHSESMAKDSAMPATEAQAKQLKNVPDDAAGAKTQEKGTEAGGMPATKAQKEQLKETPKMSSDEAETSGSDDE